MSNRLNIIRSLIVRIALCATCGIVGIGQGSHAEDDAVSRHRMSTPEQKAKVAERKAALAEIRDNAKAAKAEERALLAERREAAKQQAAMKRQVANALKLQRATERADENILKAKEALNKAQYRVLKATAAHGRAFQRNIQKPNGRTAMTVVNSGKRLDKAQSNYRKAERRLALAISKREAL